MRKIIIVVLTIVMVVTSVGFTAHEGTLGFLAEQEIIDWLRIAGFTQSEDNPEVWTSVKAVRGPSFKYLAVIEFAAYSIENRCLYAEYVTMPYAIGNRESEVLGTKMAFWDPDARIFVDFYNVGKTDW